jgi:hypothetical protein
MTTIELAPALDVLLDVLVDEGSTRATPRKPRPSMAISRRR